MRTGFESQVREVLSATGDLLVSKNLAYGDSALNPLGIFAPGDPEALIRVRIDDKLARIKNAPGAFGEDPIDDLLGYLVLLKIARRRAQYSLLPPRPPVQNDSKQEEAERAEKSKSAHSALSAVGTLSP